MTESLIESSRKEKRDREEEEEGDREHERQRTRHRGEPQSSLTVSSSIIRASAIWHRRSSAILSTINRKT